MRLNVKAFKSDEQFQRNLATHSEELNKSFFSKLKIKPGTTEMDFPEISNPKYFISYARRCESCYYFVNNTDNILKTSEETVLINYDVKDANKNIFDVFMENEKVNDMLASGDWTPEQVAVDYEKVFNMGKNILKDYII